ncbi:MAG: hypothetical protein L6N96_03635 [Candidatus Methylarchaceae archaeon HK02M2]|nr:hypothetical protein [Candidatus Methylarchaceae archaeon HK02M2]
MYDEEEARPRLTNILRALPVLLIIFGIIFAVLFFFTMFVNVPVGHSVVLVDPLTKNVSDPILGPTWAVKAPWVTAVDIYYAVDSLGMWGTGEDPFADYPGVKSFSKDQLEMDLDIMIRWRLDPDQIRELYLNYPSLNWKERTIVSIVRQTIRFISKDYAAIETIEQRDLIAQVMQDAVLQKLNEEKSLGNSITGFEFELRNIGLPDKYTTAIEAKLVAEQEKIQAEFEKDRILVLANATAQQAIIEAEGLSEAKIIIAEGTREAISMIIESAGITSSEEIAQLYLWVEAVREISSDIDVLIITTGEDGVPLLYQIP